MAFPKGHKKVGGKPKGYVAEPIKKAQEIFTQTLEGQVPHIQAAFDIVRRENPEKYLDIFAKYAQYFMPKKTEVDNTHKIDLPAVIDWTKPSEGDKK